jgi:hypothetical protein
MKIYEDLTPAQKTFVNRWFFVLIIFVTGFIFSLFLFYGVSAFKELADMRSMQKIQINAQGEGRVFAKPDIVKITATVLSDKVALADAEKDNSELSAKVLDSLKNNNIPEADIQTLSFNIYPQYSYCYPPSPCPVDNSPKIIGYQVRNTFQITVRDVAKSGDILDGIVKSGVNEVSNFQLTVDQPKKFQEEARRLAIEDAQSQAQAIAQNLGKRLVRIISFNESNVLPPPVAYGIGGGDISAKSASPISVQPGENEVVSSVVITYELR